MREGDEYKMRGQKNWEKLLEVVKYLSKISA